MANPVLPDSWRAALGPVCDSARLHALHDWLRAEECAGKVIYPPPDQRLAAFALTPLDHVRAVIVGQDPYHGPGQAHGLAFSVPRGVRIPPSLTNIYKELANDLGFARPAHGNLEAWAKAGVLLLNPVLTVEQGRAGSHRQRGWEMLTDAALAAIALRGRACVFMLWGRHAHAVADRIPDLSTGAHLLLKAPHPSPLSAHTGFFGSRPFSQANTFLSRHGRGTIDWRLPE